MQQMKAGDDEIQFGKRPRIADAGADLDCIFDKLYRHEAEPENGGQHQGPAHRAIACTHGQRRLPAADDEKRRVERRKPRMQMRTQERRCFAIAQRHHHEGDQQRAEGDELAPDQNPEQQRIRAAALRFVARQAHVLYRCHGAI